jgi:ATP-binding cassette subfamily B protein
MEFNMRNDIFTHFQKLSFNYYDNQKTGQLMSRITNDLFDVTELAHHGPEDIIISIVKIVGAFLILLNVNIVLTLIIFSVLPFMFIFAYSYNKKMHKAFKQNRARISEINAQIEDSLSGIRVVKSFANEQVEIEKFYEGNSRFVSSKKQSYMYMGRFHSGLGVFTSLINLAVIVFGVIFINKGVIKMTDLLTFLLYINNFVEPVRKLINFTEQFQNGATGFERFLEILSIEPDIADSETSHDIKNVKGNIEFENVSFKYNDTTGEVLSNINLKVKAGEYMALVGPSGAGKTTLCSLIPRFYEVSEGIVKLDSEDIKNIKLKSLRQNIGIVQQDVYLFAGTVLENISYGKPGASKEEIIAASKNANAHEFIMGLLDGYDTYIGQRGIKLSGGQKQRLSIARVFLKNPPVLIFDEATSALDNESEKVVQDSLESLAKNRTTFVIAHRLSTIKNANKILVLTDKGIEEVGTHEELLAREGVYAQLYNMQFKK